MMLYSVFLICHHSIDVYIFHTFKYVKLNYRILLSKIMDQFLYLCSF